MDSHICQCSKRTHEDSMDKNPSETPAKRQRFDCAANCIISHIGDKTVEVTNKMVIRVKYADGSIVEISKRHTELTEDGYDHFLELIKESKSVKDLIPEYFESSVKKSGNSTDNSKLSMEQLRTVDELMNGERELTTTFTNFTRTDLQTLQWNPPTKLNIQVINAYMELLNSRSRTNTHPKKVYGLCVDFYLILKSSGFFHAQQFTNNINFFEYDLLFVPIHKPDHWCLAVVDFRNKSIKVYDSSGNPNDFEICYMLLRFLKQESVIKKKEQFDMLGWVFGNPTDIPKQSNRVDCGVYTCLYAEFISRGKPLEFSQINMENVRKKMVYEICTNLFS